MNTETIAASQLAEGDRIVTATGRHLVTRIATAGPIVRAFVGTDGAMVYRSTATLTVLR